MSQIKSKPHGATNSKHEDIQHFLFEEGIMDKKMKCIPMVVRFKLDAVGIKLLVAEWVKFSEEEREKLATKSCTNADEKEDFRNDVVFLVRKHLKHDPKEIDVEQSPAWKNLDTISSQLQEKAKEFGWEISLEKWRNLTNLQRFALMKLCRPGHENKNFPKAMKEFNMI